VLPLLASDSFHSGAAGFGALMSVMGAGAFAGALASAGRGNPTHTQLATAAIALGALMLLAAGMPTQALEMAVLVPLGTAMILFQATANSLLQTLSEPRLRGRVMALYVMVFVGTTPIGGPLVGWICQQMGPRAGFVVGGVASVLAGLFGLLFLLAWRRHLVPAATAEQVA
jgi:MFS family permease